MLLARVSSARILYIVHSFCEGAHSHSDSNTNQNNMGHQKFTIKLNIAAPTASHVNALSSGFENN